MRILGLFTERRPTWRMSDIAAAVEMPVPSLYRLLKTLTSEGYLDHLTDGCYRPTGQVLRLGAAALKSSDLVTAATPALRNLAAATGATVNLGVLIGDRVLYLVRLCRRDLLMVTNIQVGSAVPAVHSSIGKLLLANLDEEQLKSRVTDASFDDGFGPNAKLSVTELRAELTAIRGAGWAIQDEELTVGLRSVAAPVRVASGRVVAGVNVAVGVQDWSIQMLIRTIKPQLERACFQISHRFNHGGLTGQ